VLHQPHHACLRRAGRCSPLGVMASTVARYPDPWTRSQICSDEVRGPVVGHLARLRPKLRRRSEWPARAMWSIGPMG
jgi:hypothetical protein